MLILDIAIPTILIITISLLFYMQLETKTGFVAGLLVAVGLGVYADVIPFWVITLVIIFLVIVFYQNTTDGGVRR